MGAFGFTRFGLLALGITGLAGCPSDGSGRPDAARADAGGLDATDADAGPERDAGPYRGSIVIDGTNDFALGETFTTTTTGYAAYVSWDDSSLYLGYLGEDIATDAVDSGSKWLLVYLDVDPGNGTGASTGETYNTQTPGFPSGFGAEYYYRWKSDDSYEDLQSWGGASWSTTGTIVNATVGGSFVEVAIPLAGLGSPAEVGVIAMMLNEKSLGEWAYAGLYADNFTDGYHPSVPVSRYLLADFASAREPSDLANRRP